MKQCPKCQTACPEDSKFCPACGTEAVEVSEEGKAVVRAEKSCYCSNCGAECTADTAFCPKCGTSLNAPAAEPETPQENRPPEINEWFFSYRRRAHNTRIMSQGTMLSVEQWKQIFTFGVKYGRKNFRLDVKDITAIVLKKSLSIMRVVELIAGVLILLLGAYGGSLYVAVIGLIMAAFGYMGLHDKYIYVQFPNGYFKIQDSFVVGSDIDYFLQYVSYYNPNCIRAIRK